MKTYIDIDVKYILLFFCAMLFMASCQQTAQPGDRHSGKYYADDSRGQETALSRPAERIVVLFEPMVDELFMLGVHDRIVGIPEQVYQNESSFRFFSQLDERIARKEIATPTYGGRANNVESIVGLRPDLAIAYE